MRRLGILGGTFNPIHNGHIEMAEAAKAELGLERVLFIPGGNPPHKDGAAVTDAAIRLEMVEKTVADTECFSAYDYEVKKDTFSYTAETLEHLKQEHPESELYFILGADSLDYIDRWYRPEKIFGLAKLVVFARDDFNLKEKAASLKFGGEIITIDKKITDVSSTEIRMLCDMGLDISGIVPKAAVDVIGKFGLYRGRYTELRERVRKAQKSERFEHTEGVIKAAVKMAKIFGEDIEKAYLAALLHDVAKNIDGKLELCDSVGVELDEFERSHPALIHAKLGAYIAKAEHGIEDKEILNAIKWHTLGRPNMSRLEKIIYVADMAEEGRDFPGIEAVREAAFNDLDEAVRVCTEQTIKYNEEKGREVHPMAYWLWEHSFTKED